MSELLTGLRRAVASPGLVATLWLASLLFALPASLLVGRSLDRSFGSSRVAERMAAGFDMDWHAEYRAAAEGLETTFTPTVAGPGPLLDALEAWWSGDLFTLEPGLVATGAGFALLWIFLIGGVLDRFAHPRARPGWEGFAAAGGRYFGRFLLLALVAGVAYFLIYLGGRGLYGWIEDATRDVTSERTVLLLMLAAAAAVVAALHAVRLVFDLARVAVVVGERRGTVASLGAGLRLAFRHPFRTGGLYLAFVLLGLALGGLGALVLPGAGPGSWPGIVLAFVLVQAVLAGRILLRLGLLAGEVELFRALEEETS